MIVCDCGVGLPLCRIDFRIGDAVFRSGSDLVDDFTCPFSAWADGLCERIAIGATGSTFRTVLWLRLCTGEAAELA